MYFTRMDTGFRGWFQVIRGNGTLRTGITPSSFTVLVVDANDTTGSFLPVTQSLQKPGLYRFDVPSTFLLSNGSGEYGISVEVNATSRPKIKDAFSNVLKVSKDDFNSLSSSVVLSTENISNIVSGVWDVDGTTHNTSASMGWLQNNIFDNTVSIIDDTTLLISGTNAVLNDTANLLSSSSLILNSTTNIENDISTFVSSGMVLSSSSVASVVSGVWSAASGAYNVSGTMGFLQNQIGTTSISASVTVDNTAIAAAVWNTLTSSASGSGTFGLHLGSGLANAVWDEQLSAHSISGSAGEQLTNVALRVREIYQILGLELGSPMTVSTVLRTVAAITQSISGDPNTTVTVTRT